MTQEPDSDRELADRLIEKFSKGNPLSDPEAYREAMGRCENEESRWLLRTIKEACEHSADALIDGIMEASSPPPPSEG